MLIPSKLSRPVRLEHTVVRERLLAKLSGANNYRLVLITSPAGYGKTTLISQWAAGKNDLGWFSLDEGDNQQERFASYLIAAIQQATGNHCAASEAMVQKRQYASLSSLFAQLFIELADWQRPLYLVIDDYHLINNPVIQTVAGCATMSPGGPPRYNSSPSPPARITPPPAASPGLTPAICRIIWWMKCWITLTPARATFC